jgi:pseudaminic acid synthase
MGQPGFSIAGRRIGAGQPPYVIAEMSGNHNGEPARALALIDAAKAAGADAVKLQTYTADTITIRSDRPEFRIEGGLWHGRTLHDLYQEAHTPWDWHEALFRRGRELGITVFSSPFDASAIALLERLGAPAYKVASPEIVDLPLIEAMARTGKPLIMSLGMATLPEIEEAIAAARGAGCRELALLHCVSGYPTPAAECNLATIGDLARRFEAVIGLSDHSMGIAVPVAAVALGACLIEKHFTLSRADGGVDSAFSLEKEELAAMTAALRDAAQAIGRVSYEISPSEAATLKFRRSLYVVRAVPAGAALGEADVRSIRPAAGLAPKHLKTVLGRRTRRAVPAGTPLSWDMLE